MLSVSELGLTALGLGLLSASALLVGAVLGLVAHWPERLVAAVMAFGNVLLDGAPDWLIAGTEALAAGGILAMLADTMMPEAFEQGGPFVALWTALGFLAAFFVRTLGHQ